MFADSSRSLSLWVPIIFLSSSVSSYNNCFEADVPPFSYFLQSLCSSNSALAAAILTGLGGGWYLGLVCFFMAVPASAVVYGTIKIRPDIYLAYLGWVGK